MYVTCFEMFVAVQLSDDTPAVLSLGNTQEATVYVTCFEMFVAVQLSDDTPAVLSLGNSTQT